MKTDELSRKYRRLLKKKIYIYTPQRPDKASLGQQIDEEKIKDNILLMCFQLVNKNNRIK